MMITLKRLLIALFAITASGLLVAGLGIANAETPAERCKRETTAYNNAWKNTWAQANPGKSPSDAPPPPVPYKCGGNKTSPPELPSTRNPEKAPDQTATPEAPSPEKSTPSDGGPSMDSPTNRKDGEVGVSPGQPTIDGGSAPEVGNTVIIPTRTSGRDIVIHTPASINGAQVSSSSDAEMTRIVVNRGSNRSVSKYEFLTEIPSGARWMKFSDGLELRGRNQEILAVLSTTYQSNNSSSLLHRGNNLVIDFGRGNRSIADIIGPAKRNASAHGCTWGRGNWGARACISVKGSSTQVSEIGAGMDIGGMPYPAQLCDREWEISYYSQGKRTVKNHSEPSCTPINAGVTYWWIYSPDDAPFLILDDGTPVCARVKNSDTDGKWSPYACKTIKK